MAIVVRRHPLANGATVNFIDLHRRLPAVRDPLGATRTGAFRANSNTVHLEEGAAMTGG